MLIDPEGKPEHLASACFAIGDNVIAADTGNTGCIVLAKASTDPDVMLKWRMSKEYRVAIFKRNLQRIAFSVMN